MEYIIEPYLPRNQVHVFAGSSGTGKTTLLLQILRKLGEPVAYIASDRTVESYNETARRIGIEPIPIFSIVDEIAAGVKTGKVKTGTWNDWVRSYLDSLNPRPNLVVYDTGLVALPEVANFNDMKQVATAMARLAGESKGKPQTTILIFHTNKTKKSEDFLNILNRISGSHGLLGYASTKALLLGEEEHDEGPLLVVQGQHFKDQRLRLKRLETGAFEILDDVDRAIEFSRVLPYLPTVGQTLGFHEMLKECAGKLSRRSLARGLSELEQNGVVKRIYRGVYRRER